MKKFLVITDQSRSFWYGEVERILSRLGVVVPSVKENAAEVMTQEYFDLVVVDNEPMEDMDQFVAKLHALGPETRIMVANFDFDWKETRDLFRAGATDVLSSPESLDGLDQSVRQVLEVV